MEPVNVLFMLSGKSYAGKHFVSSRFLAVVAASPAEWNATARRFAFKEQARVAFARAQGLDEERLLRDWDYREEHEDAVQAFVAEKRKDPVAFKRDALLQVTDDILKSCVKASGARRAFVVSDWKDRDELQVLSAALTADPAACPNLRVVKVRVAASPQARAARGCRVCAQAPERDETKEAAAAAAAAELLQDGQTFDLTLQNDGEGADGVAQVDTFVANRMLRELTKND